MASNQPVQSRKPAEENSQKVDLTLSAFVASASLALGSLSGCTTDSQSSAVLERYRIEHQPVVMPTERVISITQNIGRNESGPKD